MPLADVSHLWTKTTDSPIDWLNSVNQPKMYSYGYTNGRGSGDAFLKTSEGLLRLELRPGMPKEFALWFMGLFSLTISIGVWFTPLPVAMMVLIAIMGPICGLTVATIVYSLQSLHEQAGDYLIVDLQARTVVLPRLQVTLPLDKVSRFQLIRGPSAGGFHVQTDFHILASDETGRLIRYHILGSPTHSLVKQIVAFTQIPVEERNLSQRGDRYADMSQSKG